MRKAGPHAHTLPNGKRVALGKLAPKRDPRTLKLSQFVDRKRLPAPPDVFVNSDKVSAWGMMKNDSVGDCTCAAAGHLEMLDTVLVGSLVTPSDDEVISMYSSISGYDPATGDNDNGAVELDVLNWWRRNQLHNVGLHGFAAVNVADHDMVRTATSLFDAIYIGVALPASAQAQVGGVWDAASGYQGEPGSWGGHAVLITDYDWKASPHTLTCISWGTTQKMTEAFFAKYVDEAYACLTTSWMQRTPNPAFNYQAFNDALRSFGPVNPQSRRGWLNKLMDHFRH